MSSPNRRISPRLGVRFNLAAGELVVTGPDGRRFEAFVELAQRAEAERERAEAERERADAERERAERLAQRLRVRLIWRMTRWIWW